MSRFLSKVQSISDLKLEPFPNKRSVKVTRVAVSDGAIVALGADGTIYSNSVRKHCAYHNLPPRVMRSIVKLRVLSLEAVREHEHNVKVQREKEERYWRSQHVLECVAQLNLVLTGEQLRILKQYVTPS